MQGLQLHEEVGTVRAWHIYVGIQSTCRDFSCMKRWAQYGQYTFWWASGPHAGISAAKRDGAAQAVHVSVHTHGLASPCSTCRVPTPPDRCHLPPATSVHKLPVTYQSPTSHLPVTHQSPTSPLPVTYQSATTGVHKSHTPRLASPPPVVPHTHT